ncbi:MAG TPA: hypothetical protein VMF89_37335 [Polyangiales bacterium]|nr:hypothetical protein [Polyangiales bacterium]
MAAFLTTASLLACPHQGTVSIVSSNSRVKASGEFVVRAGDTFSIAGCPFAIGPTPHPCVTVRWIVPATRNDVLSDHVLTEDSVGLCLAADQAPQGSVLVKSTQTRVKGQ